ncbi:hypothetical protein BX616_006560 [Lobosporangium transversale]|nr:hypothetical protein BX616_006560 [Lobosporangium transversale]
MYPPSTPFLSNPKHMFMETVSNLFDSVDSSRSLKYTLEEQIRKSAQLLQTLQASGTMIENLVRGQFKELEKGVIERFENEIEHLNARVRQLEEHQGLTPPPPPPKKTKVAAAPATTAASTSAAPTAATAVPSTSPSSASAMTGIATSLNGTSETAAGGSVSGPELMETSTEPSTSADQMGHNNSSPNSGTLPTPPLTKTQDPSSAMEVEDEEEREANEPSSSSSIKNLQDRVTNLESRKD